MGNKRDREDVSFSAFDTLDDSDEFDDAVTSELAEIGAGAADKDRDDADPSNDRAEASKEPVAAPAADDEVLEPGFILGDHFEIVDLVHTGGMGHVYKAVDTRRHLGGSEQIYVAIKTMRPSVASQADAQRALEREATRTQCLSHPNIVNIFDFDQQDGQFYLVMEWLDGVSVNERLRRIRGQQLAPQFAMQVIEGVASALQHAHSKNVVHADINPSNVFITDTQEIKLLDFGVARYADDAGEESDEGIAWATRTYASPDVLSGSTPTFADDIFSLACLAYRLLSGKHPFAGSSSLEARQAGMTVPRIPGVPDERWQTLSRALSYTKADRPNSASAFLVDHTASTLLGQDKAGTFFDEPVAELDFGSANLFPLRRFSDWLPAITVVAVVLFAGLLWLLQTDSEMSPAVVTDTAALPSDVVRLLSSAAQAVDEQRFISPDENNARELYREVLMLEPSNAAALDGLRTVSDHFVQQAVSALRARAPADAAAMLATAEDVDPLNPAIATATELLVAQGDGQLANARLAAARGDVEQANEFLSNAERYEHIDADSIGVVRLQLVQRTEEQSFLDQLAIADAHITAGRLTEPAGNNARALLIELKQDHANDARLMLSLERLGQRLLTRATLAMDTRRFTAAAGILDAADNLGVLSEEVAAARSSLLRRLKEDEAARAAPVRSVDTDVAQIRSAPASADAQTPQSSRGAAVEPRTTTVANEPPAVQIRSLSDLGIEKYVAPRFPLSARRRGLDGVVEVTFDVNTDGSVSGVDTVRAEPGTVFVASAEKAVQQWRFAPRDEAVSAQITLRFNLATE